MFKGLGNIASMIRQAQQMGGRMQEMTDSLKSQRAEGAAGGGMVKAQVNGVGDLLRVEIDPTLVQRGEVEMLEELIPAAVNQALAKARQLHAEAMQSMASGMELPGLGEALARFTGGDSLSGSEREAIDDEDDNTER